MRYILQFLRKYVFIIIGLIIVLSIFIFQLTINNTNDIVKALDVEEKQDCNCEDKTNDILIDIKGAVKKPGVYRLSQDSIVNDVINGKGKYMNDLGIYEGEFIDGNKSGNGTFISKNGDKYIGQFEDNKKVGIGEMFFSNGDYYKGAFKNDLLSRFRSRGGNNRCRLNENILSAEGCPLRIGYLRALKFLESRREKLGVYFDFEK